MNSMIKREAKKEPVKPANAFKDNPEGFNGEKVKIKWEEDNQKNLIPELDLDED